MSSIVVVVYQRFIISLFISNINSIFFEETMFIIISFSYQNI